MICPHCLKDSPAGATQCMNCSTPLVAVVPAYAGIGKRIVALFLDIFIAMVLYLGLYLPLIFIFRDDATIAILVPTLAILLFALLQVILLLTAGQTVGKKLLGLKIVTREFQPAGVGKILMREIIGRMVCGLTFGIGYLIALFNPEHAGLHDKIAGTLVVQKSPAGQAAPTGYPAEPAFQTAVTTPAPPMPTAASRPVFDAEATPPPTAAPIPSPVTPPQPPPVPEPPQAPQPPTSADLKPPVPPQPAEAPAAPLPRAETTAGPASPPPSGKQDQPGTTCPGCHSPIEDDAADHCLVCGFPLKGEVKAHTRFCPSCKSPVSDDARFCAVCGFTMEADVQATRPPSQPVEDVEATIVVQAPKLISYDADGQQEEYTLQLPITKIGRLADNHISFPHEKAISGHHCVIYLENGEFSIRDLNSTNGIFVNNKKVDQSVLADGDKIKLGFKIFRFQMP